MYSAWTRKERMRAIVAGNERQDCNDDYSEPAGKRRKTSNLVRFNHSAHPFNKMTSEAMVAWRIDDCSS